MKIAIGCDQNAYKLKSIIIKHLESKEIECVDFGSLEDEEVLYPNVAHQVALEIANGNFERGILLCGTGIGMSIVANKVPGVRAAICHDIYSAQRARKSNDAQVMTLGAEIVGPALALELVDAWLESEFSGGRSQAKVDLIKELDKH